MTERFRLPSGGTAINRARLLPDLKDEKGRLIGEYMFRDLHTNPEFKPDQFKRSALTS